MATRNKRKLATLNKENCEEHPWSNLAQISNVPRSQGGYKTQDSEEIEGSFTKKLSQEFSRTENRILGALTRLDDFLMNRLLQSHSGTTPEMSLNVFSINQGTNEDDSQSDPHPEAGLLNSGREDRHDMATGVQRENGLGHNRNLVFFPLSDEDLPVETLARDLVIGEDLTRVSAINCWSNFMKFEIFSFSGSMLALILSLPLFLN